jgi:hypothetical protein
MQQRNAAQRAAKSSPHHSPGLFPAAKTDSESFFFTVWLGIKSSSTVQQEIEKSLVVMTVDQL